ncbi:MAG: type II secretion system F family protein [Oscillospiraceae bacterium]
MPEYKYTAVFADGRRKRGRLAADNSDALKKLLSVKGLYLLDYRAVTTKNVGMNARQLSVFCRELSSMLSAGINVSKALDIICARDMSRALKNAFSAVNRRIKQGESLSCAMSSQERMFPPLLISMVVSGESGGRLDRVLSQMAEHYEKEHRTRSEIRSAAAYPILLAVITLLVIIAVFTFVFPSFEPLLEGVELPKLTQTTMFISRLFTEHWLIVAAVAAAVALAATLASGIFAVRRFADMLLLKTPIIGKVLRALYTARFCRTFASLYSAGIPVLNALEIAGDSSGSPYILQSFDKAMRVVRSGGTLSKALSEVDGFDAKLIGALQVGEESGRTDELLLRLADSFEFEASEAVKRLIKLLEPVMIFIMAAIVLAVVMSVMIPIYDMYSNIDAANGVFSA